MLKKEHWYRREDLIGIEVDILVELRSIPLQLVVVPLPPRESRHRSVVLFLHLIS